MAPNKFEQHIKEELNKREIKPTRSAWDKVAKRLEKPQHRKKTNYLWLGIAASFVGLLITSTIYFNTEKPSLEYNNTLVETDKDSIGIENDINDKVIDVSDENQIANTKVDKRDHIKVINKTTKIGSEKSNNYFEKNKITEVAIVNPQLEILNNKGDFSKKKLIEQKIAEVVAKVNQLEQNDNTLTDLEVDALIQQAQKEILQNKIFRQNQSVDAMALLNEVEDELNKPLKDQLFDLLKKGVFETKNAIAARNN